MSDIKKVIEGLELIEIVIPSYKHARRKGLTDDEAETVVNWAVEQAIILLEQLRRAMYSKENTTEGEQERYEKNCTEGRDDQ